jgi:acyl-CoA synthetase (AMP-forming)/AMP-acid ligase II
MISMDGSTVDSAAATEHNYVLGGLDLFEKFGDDEAIVTDGSRLTYADVRAGVHTLVRVLGEQGVRPGDAVAVLIGNPPEAVVLQFALHALGCRSVWIAPNAPERYRMDFMRASDVSAFVYDPRVLPRMGRTMAAEHPDVKIMCLGPGGAGADLLAEAWVLDEQAMAALAARPDIPEPSSVFQTGGTTGRPKLVHHRHAFFQTLRLLSDYWVASGEHKLRHLASSGFWHVSGQMPAMMTLFSGGTLFLIPEFRAELVIAAIEKYRITSTFLTPPIMYEILDHPALRTTDTSSMQMLSVGGAAVAPSRMRQAIAHFGPVLRPVYGMSEAPFITALPKLGDDPANPDRIRSAGTPYGDIRITIAAEDGTPLPDGSVGEVWVNGALSMLGYWGQPELTGQTLVDGWVHTGDMGYLDADGYLFLVDRIKDIIITGMASTNVYSRPIEDLLAAHPQVQAAAVIGVPDEAMGEAVQAYVVLAEGATVTAEELRALVENTLNEVWAPREVDFIDALPRTDFGKVDKKALRARYEKDHTGGHF